MQEIETPRLKLRQWTEDDFEPFARFYSDEENARYVGGKKDAEQAWRYMALQAGHWVLKGFGYWAVEGKSSGDFVGCVGLWKSPAWPELELGYWIVEDHRAKGYALEACQHAIEFARKELKASSLVSYIDASNEPSIQLAERLDASYEETIELADYGPHRVYRHF